jgi:hypothetical protein
MSLAFDIFAYKPFVVLSFALTLFLISCQLQCDNFKQLRELNPSSGAAFVIREMKSKLSKLSFHWNLPDKTELFYLHGCTQTHSKFPPAVT